MPKKGAEIIDVDVDLIHQTEKAWLVSPDGRHKVWIPKSLGQYDNGVLTLPTSYAIDKGLV